MHKLKLVFALIRFLCKERRGEKLYASINRSPGGKSWFLVEPAVIWIPFKESQKKQVIVDGKVYVRIGGGEREGSYICIGDEPVFDDREPQSLEQWMEQMDHQFNASA